MKKTSTILFFCFCTFLCFAQRVSVQYQFILDGLLKGSKSDKVYLCYVDASGKFRVDSARVENGSFQMTGSVNGPTIAFITTVKRSLPEEDDDIMKSDGKNSTLFFLEPKTIRVDLQPGDFRNGAFSGSLTQTQFAGYVHQLNAIADRYKTQNDSLQTIASIDKAQKEQARLRISSIRDVATSRVMHDFLNAQQRSYVTAYLVSISHFKLDSLSLFYNRLPPEARRSIYGEEINEKIEKKEKVAIGKKAPEFKQTTSCGDTVMLSSYKGKFVLLQFWSSVNSVSRAENRALIPVYNRFKDKNFVILGIALDGQKTRLVWKAAIEKDQLPWTQLAALKSNHNRAVQAYDVQSVPVNFLISRNGKIVATDLTAEELEQLLAKIIR